MSHEIDYSPLDLPMISGSMFYPQRIWTNPPAGTTDHMIPVAPGVSISGRLYPCGPDAPSILYFHGNGEVACQSDQFAHFYRQAGANLLVVDFRGYGLSGGSPTFPNMLADARVICKYFLKLIENGELSGPAFVMGRSMGCHSAVEIAANYQVSFKGLISESGAGGIARMVERWGLKSEGEGMEEMLRLHQEKLRSITLPVLAIHGEQDELIPLERAVELLETLGSEDVTLEVIPNAGHNDLMYRGLNQYFTAVQKFVGGGRSEEA